MLNGKHFNTKFFNTKIKYGSTKSDFIKYFGFKDEEALEKAMRREFASKGVDSMLSAMSKNEKRKKAPKEERRIVSEEAVKSSNSPIEVLVKEGTNDLSQNTENELEELQEYEETLSELICKYEIEYEQLRTLRKVELNELREIERKLRELQKQLTEIQKAGDEIIRKLNCNLKDIRNKAADINGLKGDLEAIRADIYDMQTITIWVYEDGEIQIESSKEIVVPTGEEVFNSLLLEESNQDMTVKQIKQLAKVISLVNRLDEEGIRYSMQIEDAIVASKVS